MLLTSQYSAFNGLPLSIQQAKAIKHKDSAPPQGPDSNDGNTIPSSSSSQSDPDFARGLHQLQSVHRTITVNCSSARLTDINNKLHDNSILAKQSPTG